MRSAIFGMFMPGLKETRTPEIGAVRPEYQPNATSEDPARRNTNPAKAHFDDGNLCCVGAAGSFICALPSAIVVKLAAMDNPTAIVNSTTPYSAEASAKPCRFSTTMSTATTNTSNMENLPVVMAKCCRRMRVRAQRPVCRATAAIIAASFTYGNAMLKVIKTTAMKISPRLKSSRIPPTIEKLCSSPNCINVMNGERIAIVSTTNAASDRTAAAAFNLGSKTTMD